MRKIGCLTQTDAQWARRDFLRAGSLGFLGFGMRPPTPEWGLMMSENRALLIVSPITVLGPGLMLASLVVGLNLFTEGLARILGRTVRLGDK